MNPLQRKLIRELRASGVVIFSVILITAIGAACFVAMRSAYRTLSRARDNYYAKGRMADLWVTLKKMPRSEIDRLSAMPGITELNLRIRWPVTVHLQGVERPLAGVALSLPDSRQSVLNQIQIVRGEYFTSQRRNEVIINDVFASAHQLRIGQRIFVSIAGRRQELVLVGTAFSCEFIYPLGPAAIVPDRKGFGVFFLKQSFAEEITDMEGAANELLARILPRYKKAKRTLLHEIERRLDEFGVLATTPLEDYPSNTFLSQEIEGLATFAFIIPTIFLATSAIILNVVMIRRVEQQRMIIGTLKALGYSDAAIGWHIMEFALIVGAVGAVAGCVVGQWLSAGMTRLYRQFYEFPQLDALFYADIHLEVILVGIACAAIGGWKGAKTALALHPAAAMRPKAPASARHILLERLSELWKHIHPSWRIAFRHLFRHPVRSLTSLLACLLGAATMSLIFSMIESIDHLMVFHFRWLYRSNATLFFKNETGIDALPEVCRLPGVRKAEPLLLIPVTVRHRGREKLIRVTGIEQVASLTLPRDRWARYIPVPPTGFLMSRQLAKMIGIEVGDFLEWQPMRGQRRWHRTQVVGVMDDYVGTAVYVDVNLLRRYLSEESAVSAVQLATDPNPQSQASFLQAIRDRPQIEAVIFRADMESNLQKTLLQNIWIILSIEISFAGALFFGAILNGAVISLEERRRELATFYVMGYTPWQIGGLLGRESIIIVIGGLILGIPLGYFLTNLVISTYQSEVMRMPMLFPPRVWIETAICGGLFSLISHLVVQGLIVRSRWANAVKVSE
ncbi:MAG: ABC transporter permease [Thermogutta sp.]